MIHFKVKLEVCSFNKTHFFDYGRGRKMLNNIDARLTGDVLKILCDMGLKDELVIADANFPAESIAKRLVRLPGIDANEFLSAILDIFPVDVEYSEQPAIVMDIFDSDKDAGMIIPSTWSDFERTLNQKYDDIYVSQMDYEDFMKRASNAYAIIQTGEERQYGNLIISKGIVL